MLPRSVKAAFYYLMGFPMSLNGFIYKSFFSPNGGVAKVHLGPGQKNYLNGWINVDANFITAKIDVWADLRNKLPFKNESIDAFYSHHVIEHLPDELLPFHFSEMYRCLKPNGVIRIGGPNGDIAMKMFLKNEPEWFSDWPDKRNSIGGRFANFILCRGEHLTILTQSYLSELLVNAGFSTVKKCTPTKETNYPSVYDKEVFKHEYLQPSAKNPNTLIVEAIKRMGKKGSG